MAFIKKALVNPADGAARAELVATKLIPTHEEHVKAAIDSSRRDFAAEARGKTRCALEEAWAQSPLLPMLLKEPQSREELHALLDEIVSERMKRIFPNG